MLIDKLGGVVDLVVDDEEQVLAGVVLSNVLVGVLLDGGHCGCEGGDKGEDVKETEKMRVRGRSSRRERRKKFEKSRTERSHE